jgi:hypothetical protein
VGQGLVFEVADRELHDGVLAVLGLDQLERLAAVGDEREVAPARPQARPVGRSPSPIAEPTLGVLGTPHDGRKWAREDAMRLVALLGPNGAGKTTNEGCQNPVLA